MSKKDDLGLYTYNGKIFMCKDEMEKAQKEKAPKESAFQTWLRVFIEEKEIDMAEYVTAGDGTTLQVGDVFQAFYDTHPDEQVKIKEQLVKIDFVNGNVLHFVEYCAKALSAKDKVGL